MKAYVNQNQKAGSTEPTYRKGQELIWDSGSGFDVVTYDGSMEMFEGKMISCKMKTGIRKGKVIPIDKKQLKVFSLPKWAEMRRKYDHAC
jgi:hypothetical protein